MMKTNLLKRSWSAGVSTVNGWLSIGNAFTAEIMAEQGYDSLTIDIQHGFLDYTDAKGMLQAIRASQKTPLVRVPWLEPGIIMKCLDAGVHGVICPMINTPEQAARPRGRDALSTSRQPELRSDPGQRLCRARIL